MPYPPFTPNTRLPAPLLRAMQPQVVIKPVSTDRASTTTMAMDPDLWFTLDPGAAYVVEFYLFPAGSTGKIKTTWRVPTSAFGLRTAMGPGSNASEVNSDNISMRSGVHGYATEVTYGRRLTGVGGASRNQSVAVETSLVTTGSTTGVCGIWWCQATSSADTSRMGAGSWGRATRIA